MAAAEAGAAWVEGGSRRWDLPGGPREEEARLPG